MKNCNCSHNSGNCIERGPAGTNGNNPLLLHVFNANTAGATIPSTVAAGSTVYYTIATGTNSSMVTSLNAIPQFDGDLYNNIPRNTTLKTMYLYASNGSIGNANITVKASVFLTNAGSSYIFTPQLMVATTTLTNTNNVATDLTHSVVVPANDLLALQIAITNNGGTAYIPSSLIVSVSMQTA
jgi:hypothetical protein